jgi:hypothetical protein
VESRRRVNSTVGLLLNPMNKFLIVGLVVFAACGSAPTPRAQTPATPPQQSNTSTVPLTQIDLTKIGAVAPKGRIQDRDYNHLPVVENLIAHGDDAIPFLIGKLNDETKIPGHVFDYWSDVRVGDVAFIILTDFFTDPTWQKTTIPGVAYDTFLGRRTSNETGEEVLRNYIAKHGRHNITERWRGIWAQYQGRVHWDEHDRCFKLNAS